MNGWLMFTLDVEEQVARLKDGGPCGACRHTDHEHHTSAVPRWCGECHCIGYVPTDEDFADALMKLRAYARASFLPASATESATPTAEGESR